MPAAFTVHVGSECSAGAGLFLRSDMSANSANGAIRPRHERARYTPSAYATSAAALRERGKVVRGARRARRTPRCRA